MTVKEVVAKYHHEPDQLLEVLRELQREMSYLSEETLVDVARELELTVSHVYGVATFYSLYSTKPQGQFVIRVCENAPCHVHGAGRVLQAFQKELSITPGETTADGCFSLELTSCLGVCTVAPAVMVNTEVHGNLTPKDVPVLIANYRAKMTSTWDAGTAEVPLASSRETE